MLFLFLSAGLFEAFSPEFSHGAATAWSYTGTGRTVTEDPAVANELPEAGAGRDASGSALQVAQAKRQKIVGNVLEDRWPSCSMQQYACSRGPRSDATWQP